ncbi:hypothetical protein EDB85DRAFT_1887988 [Lactarius pseudohatsudake]|nr:hypothetical protein EDB85DRAFT_1887988 [Lactarius pseudohatsudake]
MSAVRRLPHTARALALPIFSFDGWGFYNVAICRQDLATDGPRFLVFWFTLRALAGRAYLTRDGYTTCSASGNGDSVYGAHAGAELGTVDHEEVLLFREKITLPNKLERYPPTTMTGIRLASGAQYEMTEFTRRAASASVSNRDPDTPRSGSSDCRMTRDPLRCLGRMHEACMGNQRRNYLLRRWSGDSHDTLLGEVPMVRKGIFNSYGFGMIKGPAMQILVSPDDRTRRENSCRCAGNGVHSDGGGVYNEESDRSPGHVKTAICRVYRRPRLFSYSSAVDAASIRDLIPDIEMSNAVQ